MVLEFLGTCSTVQLYLVSFGALLLIVATEIAMGTIPIDISVARAPKDTVEQEPDFFLKNTKISKFEKYYT